MIDALHATFTFSLKSSSASQGRSLTTTYTTFRCGGFPFRSVCPWLQSQNMSKSVSSARQRMLHYPQAVMQCQAQALSYGKCVSAKENVTKHVCDKEFQALKECVQNAMKKMK